MPLRFEPNNLWKCLVSLHPCEHSKSVTKVVLTEDLDLDGLKGKIGFLRMKCADECGWEGATKTLWLEGVEFEPHVMVVDTRNLRELKRGNNSYETWKVYKCPNHGRVQLVAVRSIMPDREVRREDCPRCVEDRSNARKEDTDFDF